MKVLFAVNLTEPIEAVRTVESLCDRLDAELYVLHVDVPLQADLGSLDASGFEGGHYSYAQFDPDLAEEIEQVLESAFKRFLQRSFVRPIRMMIRESGDPATTIIHDADRTGADILVLARKHHPFLERLVVGSVSTKVIKAAKIPVLLIPIAE